MCNIHTIWHSQSVETRVICCNILEPLHLPKAFQHVRETPKGKKQDIFYFYKGLEGGLDFMCYHRN